MASQQTERPQRPRSHSMLSAGSKKSRRSSGSKDMTENAMEKPRLHQGTKADPSAAINEAQPVFQLRRPQNYEIQGYVWK
ncbi:MAG: hypothetical protein Q9227_002468 [Pyrenula ochraceoflavens]